MNPRLDLLHAYPFERLRRLFEGVEPGGPPVNLGIGEPQHPTPPIITEALQRAMPLLGKYPPTAGTLELREAIAAWLRRRYHGIGIEEREVLPVAGTREALFAFAQAVLDPADPGVVLLPNPFYQIYEGAAIMAGAEPFYVPVSEGLDRALDWSQVPRDVWPQVKLVYVCSPGNPTGTVLGLDEWNEIFALADAHGFVIASDECYSEIYSVDPPLGALQAAEKLGRGNDRLIVFNSLSKRSSAPGLRSGFVAGDRAIIEKFLLYRTYHGCAPSLVVQAASVAAWNDEAHVVENREKYRAKFSAAEPFTQWGIEARTPAGGFFLWAYVGFAPININSDEEFARQLYATTGITVLPGSYLGREAGGKNPGRGYVRIAFVPEPDVCRRALATINGFIRWSDWEEQDGHRKPFEPPA